MPSEADSKPSSSVNFVGRLLLEDPSLLPGYSIVASGIGVEQAKEATRETPKAPEREAVGAEGVMARASQEAPQVSAIGAGPALSLKLIETFSFPFS